MKRKLLFLLIIAASVIGVHAQTIMTLHLRNGGDVDFAFSDMPVTTFEEENMIVTILGTQFTFPISDLVETTFREDAFTDGIIETVTQLSPDAGPSRIYDIRGHLLKTIPAGEPVNFGNLPHGIYIIKNNNSSYKINKAPL